MTHIVFEVNEGVVSHHNRGKGSLKTRYRFSCTKLTMFILCNNLKLQLQHNIASGMGESIRYQHLFSLFCFTVVLCSLGKLLILLSRTNFHIYHCPQ